MLWLYWSLQRQDVWSIGLYLGSDPLALRPHPSIEQQPLIAAADVTDVPADFVADPFMLQHGSAWCMFFEVLESSSGRGVIALASSADGVTWRYEHVVLREPFHLSYPYVFEWQGAFYMIPESSQATSIRLYRATQFPHQWEFSSELLSGKYWDPSIVRLRGLWWLFAMDASSSLTLHYAADLAGPWTAHPMNPIVRASRRSARPGGRVIVWRDTIIRYAQDGERTYGGALRAFEIDELSIEKYREHERHESPILDAAGSGWNASGMHHADPHQIREDHWLACVDGNRQRLLFNWRAGARQVANRLGLSRRAVH